MYLITLSGQVGNLFSILLLLSKNIIYVKKRCFCASSQPKINASISSENIVWKPGGFVAITAQDTVLHYIRTAKKRRIDHVQPQIRVLKWNRGADAFWHFQNNQSWCSNARVFDSQMFYFHWSRLLWNPTEWES